MPRFISSIPLLILCCLTSFSVYSQEFNLSPYQIIYQASYNGMPISAERKLEQLPNGSWKLTTSANNFLASITEQGDFSIVDGERIENSGYQYKRSVLGKKKTENLVYDHPNRVANYSSGKKNRQVELNQDYLNRLSYQVQLRNDLTNQREQLEYQVISRGRLSIYRFERAGEETLETAMGPVKALRVNRIREDDDRQTSLWFAPELDYLLIRLWQREKDGEEYEISIKEGSSNGVSLAALIKSRSQTSNNI